MPGDSGGGAEIDQIRLVSLRFCHLADGTDLLRGLEPLSEYRWRGQPRLATKRRRVAMKSGVDSDSQSSMCTALVAIHTNTDT